MTQPTDATPEGTTPESATPAATRKRPKPGERRNQILEMLAHMLEKPNAERITTATLAARLEVSEAALYRHFASKAQMFDALLEFIEQAIRVASPAGVVALLLPLDFAAGVDRAARLHDRWPCSCYPLRRRPAFGKEGSSGKRPVAWFVWDLGAPHRREFRVL